MILSHMEKYLQRGRRGCPVSCIHGLHNLSTIQQTEKETNFSDLFLQRPEKILCYFDKFQNYQLTDKELILRNWWFKGRCMAWGVFSEQCEPHTANDIKEQNDPPFFSFYSHIYMSKQNLPFKER